MSPGPKDSVVPGKGAIGLLTAGFRVTVTPRCSPVFTAVLVHGWYMSLLLDATTVGGQHGDVGAGSRLFRFDNRTFTTGSGEEATKHCGACDIGSTTGLVMAVTI